MRRNSMSKISDEINSKTTLEDILGDDVQIDDITASLARSCNAWYKINLEKDRREYRQELINKIIYAGLHNAKYIVTRDTSYDFITREYLEELKKYFEAREFECELRDYDTGKSDLLISWE